MDNSGWRTICCISAGFCLYCFVSVCVGGGGQGGAEGEEGGKVFRRRVLRTLECSVSEVLVYCDP